MALRPRETRPALLILATALVWASVPPLSDEVPRAAARAVTPAAAAPRAQTDEPPAGLTPDDWKQIRRTIRQSEYDASRVAKPGEAPAVQTSNRRQGYRTTFRREGIEIVPQAPAAIPWRLGLSVTGYGYEGDVRPLEPTEPQELKERVEYRRGPLTEWYANRPEWLEQGFKLQEPQPRRDARLVVAMAVRGDLDVAAGGDVASFIDPSGETRVHYAGLKAWDANGRPLKARVEAVDREVRLTVEAQTARFPVTVDPTFVHEAVLLGHPDATGHAGAEFGYSVSVSGDTAVIGAPTENLPGAMNAGAAYVFVRSGGTWTEQQRILASDAAASDRFGVSVSVSGDTAVIGAFADDAPGHPNAGSAYVFLRSGATWSQEQKLLASDAASNASFGYSVSVSADTAVVGAPTDSTPSGMNTGSAYVFVRAGTTWTEQQKLTAPDGAPNDYFGYSASIDQDTAVVGAYLDDTTGGENAGSAYVFVRSGTAWSEQQKLAASDAAAGDDFGLSVSVFGDTVLVGAFSDDVPGQVNAGSAYVFVRSGTAWAEQQKLTASDAAANAYFGRAVSVSLDTVVIGAHFDATQGGAEAGSAYVFVRSGSIWTEQQKLVASDGSAGDFFGISVSVSGDTVVVGASHIPGGANPGSAYVFARSGTTWTEQQKLLSLDTATWDNFGFSASISGDTVVVGALFDSTADGQSAGSAYVFVRSGTTWIEQQKLLPSDGGFVDNFGSSVSIFGDTLVVGAYHANAPGGASAGSAYVFVRSGASWTEQQKLVASDGGAYDTFGSSVSVSGDTLVVGASHSPDGFGFGSAYVFVRSGTTWTEQQKLLASDGAVDDHLGCSVSISGDTLVAGASGADTAGGTNAGSAYVFVRSVTTWTEQQKLVAPDGATGEDFGNSVSVFGDTVLVGAFGEDTPVEGGPGSAYVFVRSGTMWNPQQKLLASDGALNDGFGFSVSVSGDLAVIGAYADDTPGGVNAGSAYLFVRSGTTWTEQQKLLAPDGAGGDYFGWSVSASGDTVVAGASLDDVPDAPGAGSAHVFRAPPTASDVGVSKTDGQTTAVPGQPIAYTIVVTNGGPDPATGVLVTDTVPASLLGATWTCSASSGSTCAASGAGSINDIVNLLVGGTATYTLTGVIDPAATGTLTNTASVSAPSGVDPNPANNSATDTDTLTPQADLAATKTDGQTTAVPGQPVTYTITAVNLGPSDVTGATVIDTAPATILGAVWTCTASPGSSCTPSGSGSIGDTVNLLVSGTATYTLTGTLDPVATGTLVNTVTVAVPGGTTDPNAANDSATDTDNIVPGPFIDGELAHGYQRQHDLATLPGSVSDQDFFRILQRAHASYEVVLDGASGDLGAGSGPILDRLAADAATVLQVSLPAGAGGSRSLCWINALDTAVADQFVRVRSAGCTTDCDAADVYRLSAFETTGFIPRFNNSGSQITVLVLQNLGGEALDIDVRLWSGTGIPLGGPPAQTLGPRQSYVLDTSTIAPGSSGSISVANSGRYGQLSGKAVAVEPGTGFSFDTALATRPR